MHAHAATTGPQASLFQPPASGLATDPSAKRKRLLGSLYLRGYAVVRGLLSREDIESFAAATGQLAVEYPASPIIADGVTRDARFWPLIAHPRLLEVLRQAIGPTLRYAQHADIVVRGEEGFWRRDAACQTFGIGPDWDERQAPYRLVRALIRLGGDSVAATVNILPGSHRCERPLGKLQRWCWNRWRRLRSSQAGRCERFPHPPLAHTEPGLAVRWWPPTSPEGVELAAGDCLLLDRRVLYCPGQTLQPAVYLSYGAEDHHTHNHYFYYHHVRRELGHGRPSDALREILQGHGLYLSPPEASGVLRPAPVPPPRRAA